MTDSPRKLISVSPTAVPHSVLAHTPVAISPLRDVPYRLEFTASFSEADSALLNRIAQAHGGNVGDIISVELDLMLMRLRATEGGE